MSRQPLLRGSTVPWDPVPDPRSAIPPKQLKVDMSVEARQLLDDTRELLMLPREGKVFRLAFPLL